MGNAHTGDLSLLGQGDGLRFGYKGFIRQLVAGDPAALLHQPHNALGVGSGLGNLIQGIFHKTVIFHVHHSFFFSICNPAAFIHHQKGEIIMCEEITNQARTVVTELLEQANLKPGSLLVVGCSSSEMVGVRIGKGSSMEAAQAAFQGIYPILQERGIELAVQCCEHLNRALILERTAAEKRGYEIVNVKPQPKAGGSFAVTAWNAFSDPVAVEQIAADAGIDIGGTLIGMHLRRVAVPVRTSVKQIGQAIVLCARTRPKYIGGPRAIYQEL